MDWGIKTPAKTKPPADFATDWAIVRVSVKVTAASFLFGLPILLVLLPLHKHI